MTIEENKARILAFLQAQGIAFERLDYPPIRTVAEGEAISARLGTLCCKCLLLKNRKRELFLFMMPGGKRFKSSEAARLLGTSHLSFADEEDLARTLRAFPGAVNPLGLLFDTERKVRLVLDREILEAPFIDCHPCDNGCSLKLSVSDFTKRFLPAAGHGFETIALAAG